MYFHPVVVEDGRYNWSWIHLYGGGGGDGGDGNGSDDSYPRTGSELDLMHHALRLLAVVHGRIMALALEVDCNVDG